MHWSSINGDTGTQRLLRLSLQWLDKISTLSSGNYGHANSASTTNQRPSRLKKGTRLTDMKDCLCRWKDHFNDLLNPLAGRATFLSPTVHGRSDNIVVFP